MAAFAEDSCSLAVFSLIDSEQNSVIYSDKQEIES